MRLLLPILALVLPGCASDRQGGIVSTDNTDNVAVIRLGVIESVTPIEMDASSGSGPVGGALGQVGGASAGRGRGAEVGSILGTVLGGTLGQHAGIATQPGLEIWIKLDGEEGKSAYVMQPGNPGTFKIGDRVRVVRKKSETRAELEIARDAQKEPSKPR